MAICASRRAPPALSFRSGSSRLSRRNRTVAGVLEAAGFGTLLLDLLTPDEDAVDERTREYRFDIELLGRRVIGATGWMQARPDLHHLPVAFFGASTGAAAALIAAVARSEITRLEEVGRLAADWCRRHLRKEVP